MCKVVEKDLYTFTATFLNMESLENFLTYLKIRLALLEIYSNLKNLRHKNNLKKFCLRVDEGISEAGLGAEKSEKKATWWRRRATFFKIIKMTHIV